MVDWTQLTPSARTAHVVPSSSPFSLIWKKQMHGLVHLLLSVRARDPFSLLRISKFSEELACFSVFSEELF